MNRWLPFLLTASLAACGADATDDAHAISASDDAAVVDSALAMPVLIDRFRADVADPGRLKHRADDRDALVHAVVHALEQADTSALEALAIDRAEFAWLYFPGAPVAQAPYELPPGVAWLQIQQESRLGALRALRDLGGRDLELHGYACAPDPQLQGDNRVWTDCRMSLTVDGGASRELRLFGAILERDGELAILSFANDF